MSNTDTPALSNQLVSLILKSDSELSTFNLKVIQNLLGFFFIGDFIKSILVKLPNQGDVQC
mgnify:CR=1 FL=1